MHKKPFLMAVLVCAGAAWLYNAPRPPEPQLANRADFVFSTDFESPDWYREWGSANRIRSAIAKSGNTVLFFFSIICITKMLCPFILARYFNSATDSSTDGMVPTSIAILQYHLRLT